MFSCRPGIACYTNRRQLKRLMLEQKKEIPAVRQMKIRGWIIPINPSRLLTSLFLAHNGLMGISNQMIFGYGRPKNKQEANEQKLLLQEQGCETVLMERAGAEKIRDSQLEKLIGQLRTGDKVMMDYNWI